MAEPKIIKSFDEFKKLVTPEEWKKAYTPEGEKKLKEELDKGGQIVIDTQTGATTFLTAEAVKANAEVGTVEKAEAWIKTQYEEFKKTVNTADVNKDGKADLAQFEKWLDERGVTDIYNTAKDKVVGAGKKVGDLVEEKGPDVAKAVNDNKYGLMGGLLGALLMMGLFEMGPIAALLIGMLLFAAISAMGADSNGLLSGLFGSDKDKGGDGVTKKVEGPAAGQNQQQGTDIPAPVKTHKVEAEVGGKVNVLDPKDPNNKFALISEKDKDGKQVHELIGKISDDNKSVTITGMRAATKAPDGSMPILNIPDGVTLPLKDGVVDLSDVKLKPFRDKLNLIATGQAPPEPKKEAPAKAETAKKPDAKAKDTPAPPAPAGAASVDVNQGAETTFMINKEGRAVTDEKDAIGKITGVAQGTLFVITGAAVRDGNGNFQSHAMSAGISPKWAYVQAKDGKIDLTNPGVREAMTTALQRSQSLVDDKAFEVQALKNLAENEKQAKVAAEEKKKLDELKKNPELREVSRVSKGEIAMVTMDYKYVDKNDKVKTCQCHGFADTNGQLTISSLTPPASDERKVETKMISPIIVKAPDPYDVRPISARETTSGVPLSQALGKAIDKAEEDSAKAEQSVKSNAQPNKAKPMTPEEVKAAIKGGYDKAMDYLGALAHTAPQDPNKSGDSKTVG